MEYKGQINIYGCINKGKTIKNKRIKAGTTWIACVMVSFLQRLTLTYQADWEPK